MQKSFDFVGNLKRFAIISCALMLVGILLTVIVGPKLSIEFSGGTRISYSFTGDIKAEEVEALYKSTIGKEVKADISTDLSGSSKKLNVSLSDKETLTDKEVDSVLTALQKKYEKGNIEQLTRRSVSASVGTTALLKSLYTVLLAGAFILIYVAIRFKKIGGWSAGATALVALVHDVLIAFFTCVALGLSIDNNFIAVVLTLFGYSLNSTIVAFDRIRENRRLEGNNAELGDLVNRSINQILRRTIMTTLTTFMAIATVFVVAEVMGLTTLRSLTIPMCVGLLSGAYSSVCISPALWVAWQSKRTPKKQKKNRAMV